MKSVTWDIVINLETMYILRYTKWMLFITFVTFIEKVQSQCSGSTQTITFGYTTGSLQSPGYNTGYNQNSDCSWLLRTTDTGASIIFQIRNIWVPCSGDLIEAYDGTDNTGTDLSSGSDICSNSGNFRSVMIAASGNVFLRFTSDGDDDGNEKGFEVYYLTARDYSGTGCSGTTQSLTATTTDAYLSSKNFPSNYDINLSCTWTITTTDNSEHVYIELIYMDIEFDGTCQYDYLQISDPTAGTNPKICQQDDWNPSNTYTSNGTSFTITFVGDNENSRHGFLLKYTQTQATTTTTTTTTAAAATTTTTTTTTPTTTMPTTTTLTTSSNSDTTSATNTTAAGSTGKSSSCNIDTCVTPAVVCSVIGALAITGAAVLGAAQAKGVVNLKSVFSKYKLGNNKVNLAKIDSENTAVQIDKPTDKMLDTNENVTTETIAPEIVNTDINTGNIIIVTENG